MNCNRCVYLINEVCCVDPVPLSSHSEGCSRGAWVVKMLKWRGKSKIPPQYIVDITWIIQSRLDGEKFEIINAREI